MFSRRMSLATTLFASLASATALADEKRIGANDCLLEYDDPGYSGHDDWDRGDMRFGTQNPWPEYIPMNVTCPLVRSNTTNTTGLTSLKLRLHKEVSTTFTCFALSTDQNGSAIKSVLRSTNQTGAVTLDWTNTLNQVGVRGTYGISCGVIGSTVDDHLGWGDELENIYYNEP